jgi:acetyltransferase-like isoleucine patch superfamily enzyme
MEIKGGVDIGENCWIGARATILDGVTVGKNAVIGAHSLVKDDVPENAVVAGTPAKVIKVRDTGAESSNQ